MYKKLIKSSVDEVDESEWFKEGEKAGDIRWGKCFDLERNIAVSYTHLDVYKRQTGIFGQSLSKFFYNPDIQTVIKIQKRCINVYRFCYIFGNS